MRPKVRQCARARSATDMRRAAKELEFEQAAGLRDRIAGLRRRLLDLG